MESTTVTGSAYDERVDLIDELVEADRRANRETAARLRVIDRLRREHEERVRRERFDSPDLFGRGFRAEIATALRISERAAENLVGISGVLSDLLPSTFAAFDGGDFSFRHANILADAAAGLEPNLATELEDRCLPKASKLSPPRFADFVRRAREALDPVSIDERQDAAFEKRSVTEEPGRDGMSYLTIYAKAITNQAIHDRLTRAALAARASGDPRTLAQLRADLATTVLLASDERAASHSSRSECPDLDDTASVVTWFRTIVPTVMVTVPVLALLGDDPSATAELEGYGPISLRDAKILAARARSFRRILTHPVSGVVLAVDRRRYKVPKQLRDWLRARDGTCRFPGCGRRAQYCDVDHTEEWQHGGRTNHDNLAHLCRGHHLVKGNTDWKVAHASRAGELEWTSPKGKRHTTYPATQLPTD